MSIISVEQADRLYWLGRYTERVYSTLSLYFRTYDVMIDEIADSYPAFCESLDIPNIYADKEDFSKRYPFDETNPDSIVSNMNRAYDNAIVLRESIGSEALAYIQLAIYEFGKAKDSASPILEMQNIIDNIMAFWGIVDDQIDDERIRNILKAGKRVERVDLYARLGVDNKELVREVTRLVPRIENSGLSYDHEKLLRICERVQYPNIDYYRVVAEVETLFEKI